MLIFKGVNVLKGDLELTRTLEAIKALEVGSVKIVDGGLYFIFIFHFYFTFLFIFLLIFYF